MLLLEHQSRFEGATFQGKLVRGRKLIFYTFLYLYMIKASPRLTPYRFEGKAAVTRLTALITMLLFFQELTQTSQNTQCK